LQIAYPETVGELQKEYDGCFSWFIQRRIHLPRPNKIDHAAAAELFDRFARAFAAFDAAKVAELFAIPSVALGKNGSIAGLSTRQDLLGYYQAALDTYKRMGCRTCRWAQLEVCPMGAQASLATVSWELLRADGSIALRWRQSYCLSNHRDGPRIFGSARHTD
jgi:hypothetical protein